MNKAKLGIVSCALIDFNGIGILSKIIRMRKSLYTLCVIGKFVIFHNNSLLVRNFAAPDTLILPHPAPSPPEKITRGNTMLADEFRDLIAGVNNRKSTNNALHTAK